mgnify:CR=1 FL=1
MPRLASPAARTARPGSAIPLRRPPRRLLLALALAPLAGCDLADPEVVVVNRTGEPIQLRNLGFNGCLWNTVLRYGDATSPGRCLPGEDHVHFQKLDAAAFCRDQAEEGGIEGVCPCDHPPEPDDDADLTADLPNWFNYRTTTVHRVDYGDFRVIEITLDGIEQDFSVPGPYGH